MNNKMIEITYINGIITFDGFSYQYKGYDKIDDKSITLLLGEGAYGFIGGLTKINGELKINSDDIISSL